MILDKQIEKVVTAIGMTGKEICENEKLTVEQMLVLQEKQLKQSNLLNYLISVKNGFAEQEKKNAKIVTL